MFRRRRIDTLGFALKHRTLHNGAQLYFAGGAPRRSVALGVYLPVGSRDDAEGEEGSAHLVEHAVFHGSTLRPTAYDVQRDLSQHGAKVNAETSWEFTAFHAEVLSEHLQGVLTALLDIIFHAHLDEYGVNTEKSVIMREIDYRSGGGSRTYYGLHSMLFPASPYARSILGTEESVQRLKLSRIKEFHNRHYNVSEAAVVVAGSVDRRLMNMVEQCLTPLKGRTARSLGPVRYAPGSSRLQVYQRDSDDAFLRVAFPTISLAEAPHAALSVLAALFAGHKLSRLWKKLREDLGVTYAFSALQESYIGGGYFGITCELKSRDVPFVLRLIRGMAEEIGNDQVSTAELESAKSYVIGRSIMNCEDNSHLVERIGTYVVAGQDPSRLINFLDDVRAVSREQVREVARRYLVPARLHVAVAGRVSQGELLQILGEDSE